MEQIVSLPKAAIFDLDDTLAESFQPPSSEMIERLSKLLENMPVSILSAAGFPRMESQFLDILTSSPHINRLFIFANSASQCYTHTETGWQSEYNLALTSEERSIITKAIEESVQETGVIDAHPLYTAQIIDRGVQIAYAALGLNASAADKRAWDPDQSKRKRLKEAIESRIPNFEVLVGGMTTIDITRKGINKAYGVEWLSKRLECTPNEMLFVGDALYEGGNDAVVIPTGIKTISVTSPKETAVIIDELLALCTR